MLYKRTQTCGELTVEHVGRPVVLNGWVDAWRDFGGLVFIDLRDRYGVTQVVFEPEAGAELQARARELRNEYVIGVKGTVAPRLAGKENLKLITGAIEVRARELVVYNASPTPPFEMHGPEPNEELRLTYRYLDLRRPSLQQVFIIRHRLAHMMRRIMTEMGFLEVETPILGRSTPEGARDFLVPSRVHAGHFYALPQSPQLYKQLLMVSGFDRYFQIARCFRDEDLRANRQPEFTQLDVEMSFVDDHDVTSTMEILVAEMAREFTGQAVNLPLPRLDYHDVMERFGSDRPDLRYGLELKDLADIAGQTEFKVFQQARDNGHRIRGLCAAGRRHPLQPQGPRRPDRVHRRHGCQGARLAQGRGRNPDRSHGQVLPGGGAAGPSRAARRQGRRPDPDRRRYPGRDEPGTVEPAGTAGDRAGDV